LNEEPQIFITTLGWTYCRNENDLKNLNNIIGLPLALEAVKNRGRNNPIDGIYSILGLLPYGDKVIPRYKELGCQYTKKELGKALLDVMKVAVRNNNYGEVLTWFGPRRNESNL